jgi:hypothetical protein
MCGIEKYFGGGLILIRPNMDIALHVMAISVLLL